MGMVIKFIIIVEEKTFLNPNLSKIRVHDPRKHEFTKNAIAPEILRLKSLSSVFWNIIFCVTWKP